MPVINLSDEDHVPSDLYLAALPPEFIRPGDLFKLQERIIDLRLALEQIANFGDENPNKIFIQAGNTLIQIARSALEADNRKEGK